jgi:hypothetical protein
MGCFSKEKWCPHDKADAAHFFGVLLARRALSRNNPA